MCSNGEMPPWSPPSPETISHDVGLYVMNSLTRKKERFVSITGDRTVRWYMCGPTVYAPSHMGHARTYLGFDIIRRILASYFHYDVTLVMNVTDLDDKIIERSKENGVSCGELTRQFEEEFHEDMVALGVAPADALTRVTEYMPEIVEYIRVIVEDRKMAYESNGSVYFDVEAFRKDPEKHHYCKLAPEQINNAELLAEGEGKLTQDFLGDKRSPRDFALWKKSKEGEPSWPSPWGEGRPGWHIECSVMASDMFSRMGVPQGRMDIHSGGVDLKFPHHDNEMAQAEAHADCKQWVNYFVHAGHLHIKGFKMSKSLKNFITIRQALENNTARQIRICFLLHKYNAPMDYGDNTMQHAVVTEKLFVEFFHNVKAALRSCGKLTSKNQMWGNDEHNVNTEVSKASGRVDAALRDDFDTPAAMTALADLVKAVNVYLDSKEAAAAAAAAASTNGEKTPTNGNAALPPSPGPNGLVIRSAALYVTKILKVFGLVSDGDIGFGSGGGGGTAADDASSKEEVLTPVLDALMSFRSNVRDKARAKDTGGVLSECDAFRDEALPPLGVRLEDKTGGQSVWKLDDPATLMKEREQKELEKQRKAEEKRLQKLEQEKKDALNKMPPAEFMKQLLVEGEKKGEDGKVEMVLKYSKFGEDGMPTHMGNGEEMIKSQVKRAKKEFDAQKKKYDKWVASQSK